MCIDKSANIVGTFYKKELQKMNKKFLEEKLKKYLEEKQ